MVFVTLNNLSLVKFSNFNQVRGLLGRGLHIAYVINVQNDLKRLQLELFNYLIDTRLVIIRIKFDAWHHNSAGNHKTCQKERHSKIMKPQKLNTFNLFIYLFNPNRSKFLRNILLGKPPTHHGHRFYTCMYRFNSPGIEFQEILCGSHQIQPMYMTKLD